MWEVREQMEAALCVKSNSPDRFKFCPTFNSGMYGWYRDRLLIKKHENFCKNATDFFIYDQLVQHFRS